MQTLLWSISGWLPRLWFQWQAIPQEPAGTVEKALKKLRYLSSQGQRIPENVKSAVLAARQELARGDGSLTTATGSAFYDAYRELTILAARLGDEDEAPLADAFCRAVVNSEYLLKYASESGRTVPPEVQADLIAGQAAAGGAPDSQVKARFYSAYATLANMLGSVTADTIKACRSSRTKRALERDERRAITLAIVTVSVSVLLFTAASIDRQLSEEIAAGNDLAIRIRGTIFPTTGAGIPGVPLPESYVHDPCKALTETPKADDFKIRSQADLDQLQNFAIALRGTRARAARLNGFILNTECDPFDRCWWPKNDHNERVAAITGPNANPPLRDRFELNPAIGNYTAEFLCKVQTWQEVRDFAVNIQKSYGAIFGGLVAQALPILYALLGAYAYRLRLFSETVRNRTFHPSFADSARLITAIIAGAVAGLFNPVRDMSWSPLATAFLVGYGVEIFFRMLDTLVHSLDSVAPGGAPRSTLPATPQRACTDGMNRAA